MLCLLLDYLSISHVHERQVVGDCTAVKKKKRVMPPLCTPAERNRDACRVMNTFQLPSRPVTQGHVGTVALGLLRKADSYTVTVLERTAL